jgi:hypothetical protein
MFFVAYLGYFATGLLFAGCLTEADALIELAAGADLLIAEA